MSLEIDKHLCYSIYKLKKQYRGYSFMFSAIVYKSTTGSCKKYADLLSARLHIPAFPLGKEYIPADTKIIYVGWLFAGKIMGY